MNDGFPSNMPLAADAILARIAGGTTSDTWTINRPIAGANLTLTRTSDATSTEAVRGNDSRLTDARTPTTHATSHQFGGGDAIKLDDLATPDDNTDLDATTGRHGLLPKLGGGTSNFLRADGTWAAPSASAAGEWWARITNATAISITSATTATIDRLHYVTGTSADYDITLPAASSNSGKVIGFVVKDWAAANKAYRLDAGSGVKIVGRSRYLSLIHTNVALLISDGTDWQPLVLCLDTIWVDGGDFEIYGSTTNPTKGTNTRNQLWRRVGDSCEQFNTYTQTEAGASGTGWYLLPTVFTVRTGHPVNTSGSVHCTGNSAIGYGGCAWNETQYGDVVAHLYSTTRFRASITYDESRGWFGTGHGSLSSASVVFGIRLHYPVQYW